MILESLVTTQNTDGQVNLAPLGPIVADSFADETMPEFLLRPYQGSQTCANLLSERRATIHVVDDVLLIAQTAVGSVDLRDRIEPMSIEGAAYHRLKRCHRWFAAEVVSVEEDPPRYEMKARTIQSGCVDAFFGFNRAKHVIIELSVLATRVGLVPDRDIVSKCRESITIIDKTAGRREREAFVLLWRHIAKAIPGFDEACPLGQASPMRSGGASS
ncbi:MAG: DUF447 domain-containing protein [Planctomycetota bacterium]